MRKGGRASAKPMTYDKEKYRRTCTLIEFLT